ncbi:MAG: apolipoprotein N-acyltransferase [Verrucomicrobiota bacterium]
MADNQNVPLVVDLDGTLIRTDMMWESLSRRLRRNPLALFQILFWWTRGRAHLKQELAERVQIDPTTLPYHQRFIAWLQEEKKTGRKIILATASDFKMAQPVADHTGLFDEVLASDGQTNLRSENKLRALIHRYGERGFDYAGNSTADYAVWRGARQAVVVNASRRVLHKAANCAQLGPTFCEDFSALTVAKSVIKELFWNSGYFVAIIAGLLLAGAFPRFNIAGFAWIAPALMLSAAYKKNTADSLRVGYIAGLTFWLASLIWLLKIPVTGFPILGWISLAGYLALYGAVWVWLASIFQAKNPNWTARTFWTLTVAAAWVALEFLRGWLFSGFPWNFIGVSQFKLVPLIQIAAVTGVQGVSFLVVWFSLALFSAAQMVLKHPARRFAWQSEIVLPLTVIGLCYAGGFYRISQDDPAGKHLRVTAIQPSVPQTLIWSASEDSKRLTELLDLSQRALTNPTDLVLWPESAVPSVDKASYEAINQFARSNHVWLILNTDDVALLPRATNYFNSAFLIGPDGRWRQTYHKRQLVIFGEYVPLASWLPFLKWLTPITGGWTAGDQAAQFEISTTAPEDYDPVITLLKNNEASKPETRQIIKASPLICFEDIFPRLGRDAVDDDTDFLVNLTNDGWFGESSEQWQHAAAAVFRAVENKRPLIRCANNGVTCLIDSHGRILQSLTDASGSVHRRGAMTSEIPAAQNLTATYYHRHGDWFAWVCVGLTAISLLKWFRKRNAKACTQ